MLDIDVSEMGRIRLSGRFHAAHVDEARAVFETVAETCVVSFDGLDYISSAGMSVLLETQKRLMNRGHELRLTDMRPAIRNVFVIAGFDTVFDID